MIFIVDKNEFLKKGASNPQILKLFDNRKKYKGSSQTYFMEELTVVQEKKVEKVIKQKVEKEVKKRLDQKMAYLVKSSAQRFRNEFKKQTLIAITGAFAFLIALTWRTPIQNSVDKLILKLGLTGQAIYYEYLVAILITIIGVIVLIFISKWAVEQKV